MRALLYVRVSKDRTGAQRSVREQEDSCRAEAARHEWEIVGVESDNDRSASRYATKIRPGWSSVLARLAAGEVDVLMVWEASRATRDPATFAELAGVCRRHNVLLSYSGRLLDLDRPDDSFAAGLDALLSERESSATRERIMRAIRANAAKGRPHGKVGYGFVRVHDERTGALIGQEHHPEQAADIRELVRAVLAGTSAYELEVARGWRAGRVRQILTTPGITGLRVYQGEVIGDADWPPIVDRATWARLQRFYSDPDRRRYGRHNGELEHLLSGIARCRCGDRLYWSMERGVRAVYGCRGSGSGHVVRAADRLEAHVVAIVLGLLEREPALDYSGGAPTVAPSVAESLRERLAGATAAYGRGEISVATLARVEADLGPRIAAATRAERKAIGPATTAAADMGGPGAADRWNRASVAIKREVVDTLVSITVHPSTVPGSHRWDPSTITVAEK